MYPDSPGSPDSRDCRRLLQGTTADDPFLTGLPFAPSKGKNSGDILFPGRSHHNQQIYAYLMGISKSEI